MLRIKYVNVQGLSADKLEKLREDLVHDLIDILVLAETWFLAGECYLKDPLFICVTPKAPSRSVRGTGGIVCLAQQKIRNNIRINYISHYMIALSFHSFHAAFVYFPPTTMNNSKIESNITALETCHALIGDINCRFGASFNDTSTSNVARARCIASNLHRFQLSHLTPRSGTATTDHVFSSLPTEFHIQKSTVRTDHTTLYIEINIAGLDFKPSGSTRRFRIAKLNDDSYLTAFQQRFRQLVESEICDITPLFRHIPLLTVKQKQDLIDRFDLDITKCIRLAAEEIIGSYPVEEVKMRPDSLWAHLASTMNPSTAAHLFKRANRINAKKLRPRDPQIALKDEVFDHFSSVFVPNDWDRTEFHPSAPLYNIGPDELRYLGVGDEELLESITSKSTWKMIKNYKLTKACGIDSIHTKMLVSLKEAGISSLLTHLFRLCAATGLTPRRWNQSVVFPLPKTHDAETIDKTRPISLTVMFRRLFEQYLIRFIENSPRCKTLRKFHRTQAGFRRGHSTLLHAALSNDLGRRFKDIHRGFIDFKQAYDRVPIGLLLNKLAHRGCPLVLISLFASLYYRCYLSVVVNGSILQPVETERGLLQGSLTAPFLFNCFIDDLAVKLNPNPTFTSALLFADDIEIIALNAEDLQNLFDITSLWAESNGMVVGISKCASMSPTPQVFTLSNQDVPIATSYRYLGFPHYRRRIDFLEHAQNMSQKALAVLNICKRQSTGWSEIVKLSLFRSHIRSRIEYGIPLILADSNQRDNASDYFKPLSDIWHKSLRWIIPYSNSATKNSALCGTLTMFDRAIVLSASFESHLYGMSPDHPAHKIIRYWNSKPPIYQPGILFPRLLNSPLHDQIFTFINDKQIVKRVTYNWTIERLMETTKTARYIPTWARTDGLMDKTLSIRDVFIREAALRWRLGHVSGLRGCPLRHDFTKRCITERHFDIPIDNLDLPQELITATDGLYNIMDHQLNKDFLDDFYANLQYLESTLRHVGDCAPIGRHHLP